MSDERTGPSPAAPGAGRVLVIGSLNMDLVVPVERHPTPGETVLGGDLRTYPGGKGGNQAAAAARAGARAAMLGRVGTDAHGEALREALRGAGVDDRPLGRAAGPSGVALIAVAADGENTIIVSPGANGRLGAADVEAAAASLDAADVLLAQLEIPPEAVRRAAELARERARPFVLNAAPAARLDDALLGLVTVLVVNESEAGLLSGLEPTPDDLGGFASAAAEALLARGPEAVVVTLGPEGALWRQRVEGDEAFPDLDAAVADAQAIFPELPDGVGIEISDEGYRWRLEPEGLEPGHAVEAVDTTAAGDAFCGALCARLAAGDALDAAVRFANAAGALATTREGAQPSLPSAAEIQALLDAAPAA